MEYRKLGTTELQVSVVAIGTWAMGGYVPTWGPVDDNESITAIKQGIDLGMTLIDTAPAYGHGHSEEVVGNAIADRRDQVVVATKCGLVWSGKDGPNQRCLKPDTVRKECEASLRRLRIETIDLYQIHWPDPETPIADTMATLLALRDQGKIRVIGVSNFSCEQMSQARQHGPIHSLQTELSMLEPQARDELLPYCQEYGMGVLAFAPFARGLLTGKFAASSRFNDLRAKDRRYTGTAFQSNLALIEKLCPIAADLGCTMAQLAIRWVIQQAGVATVVTGAKRLSQVEEDAGAGDITIPNTAMDAIDAILTEHK